MCSTANAVRKSAPVKAQPRLHQPMCCMWWTSVGERMPLNLEHLQRLDRLGRCRFGPRHHRQPIAEATLRNLYDGMPVSEVQGRHLGRSAP